MSKATEVVQTTLGKQMLLIVIGALVGSIITFFVMIAAVM